MRILFLTQILPYPPDAGPKVKTWHVIRYLANLGHRVTLATFVRSEEEKFVPDVEKIVDKVYSIPMRRSRLADVVFWLRSNFSGRPFLIERDDIQEMRSIVKQIIDTEGIDIVHADQISMTQFARPPKNLNSDNWPITIFDAHNAVWTIIDRLKHNAHWFVKPILSLETERMKRYEGEIVQNFDKTLVVTKEDRMALSALIDKGAKQDQLSKISIIPIAVDTNQLKPSERNPNSSNILTMGTLHYPPNADGIRWFLKEVFPIIKSKINSSSLTIIGKNPPADFLEIASENPGSIEVTGYVPDLNPYMDKAALMVVPVRAGGGMRVRILEGFARAIPMVTTTIGLEGIDAESGLNILVEDSEEGFAEAVIQLITDTDLRNKLAKTGRNLAEQKYDWQVVLSKLGKLYENI